MTDSIVIQYFGERWDAPAFDYNAEKVLTPVGGFCLHCEERIEYGDSGTFVNGFSPVHIECWLRMMLGGVNHLLGTCSCAGGDQQPDPEHISRRDAARMVKTLVEIRRQADAEVR